MSSPGAKCQSRGGWPAANILIPQQEQPPAAHPPGWGFLLFFLRFFRPHGLIEWRGSSRSMGPDDRETLDRLVVEHHAPMLRLATRLTGRLETAEEIIQEAMLRIARSWSGFRAEADFKTWATRIVVNVFRD